MFLHVRMPNTNSAGHFLRALEKSNKTEQYSELVLGFCDTLPAFKELFPERKSHSQENLAKDLLQSTYNAHNALNDVQMLQKLSDKFLSAPVVVKHGFSFSWYQDYTKFLSQKRGNLQTLQPLITAKAISMGIAEKVAASELSFTHLFLSFQRGGIEGLSNVLKEKFNGKACVTLRKQTIMKICDAFGFNRIIIAGRGTLATVKKFVSILHRWQGYHKCWSEKFTTTPFSWNGRPRYLRRSSESWAGQ